VLAHLNIGPIDLTKKPSINVNGYYTAVGADSIGQPMGDRAGSATYLEASPARPDAECVQTFCRPRVHWGSIGGTGKANRNPNLPVTSPKFEAREVQFTSEAVLRIYPVVWFYE